MLIDLMNIQKNQKIKFFDIHAETDTWNPNWYVDVDEKTPNELGQFTKIINSSLDGGDIEIFFVHYLQ